MIISSGSQKILIKAPRGLLGSIKASKFLFNYIPEVSIIAEENENTAKLDFSLNINDSKERMFFKREENIFTFEGNLSDKVSLEDIITVIDYCFDFIRQKGGIYCVHGSSVSYKGKGVLFVGSVSGLGKTTLALSLCQNYKFLFIGDEKILINNKEEIIGGSKHISYNKEVLNESLNYDFNNKTEKEISEKIGFSDTPVPISLVVQPGVFPLKGVQFLEEDNWSSVKASFHFYEELTRKIRGISRRVAKYSYPLLSLDTDELAGERVTVANNVAGKVPFWLLKGDVDSVAKKIITLLD